LESSGREVERLFKTGSDQDSQRNTPMRLCGIFPFLSINGFNYFSNFGTIGFGKFLSQFAVPRERKFAQDEVESSCRSSIVRRYLL